MASTPATGTDGSVTFITNHDAKFASWTLNISQALVDVTGYDSSGYFQAVGGLKSGSWTVAATLKYDAASHNPGATEINKNGGAMVLTVATGCTYSFTGIIISVGLSSDVGAGARVVYSGVTSGTITEAWDEA
jgi:predicted secreted protein